MEKIRIKCPSCGAILEALDNPANVGKIVICPSCKVKNKFEDYIRVVRPASNASTPSAGYLIDLTTQKTYPLYEGRILLGRMTYKTPPKANLPIATDDAGMSREHLYLDVVKSRDDRFHVYASNAKNQNPSSINGVPLADGDKIGLRHGDVLTLCNTRLRYVGTPVDDETIL